MCMYVTVPLTESAPMLVIPKPAGDVIPATNVIRTGSAAFFEAGTANMVYASDSLVPTDTIVAMDGSTAIYMDQVTKIGSSYAKVPETTIHAKEYIKRGFAGDGEGHAFGYGTCMWLRACTASELPGSACTATLSNVLYKGFCFSSDTGTLECGRLSAMDDEYGEKPIAFDFAVSPNLLPSTAGVVVTEGSPPATTIVPSTPGASGTAYRCPTGSPAKSLGSFVSKRPLAGGCMDPTDANYVSLAEVHVSDYCATPGSYKPGCMMPGALNFDPAAKTPTMCKYPTNGCMDSTALNYNSGATIQAITCIPRVLGCTIGPGMYTRVDSNTPAYKSGFYGAHTAAGGVDYGIVSETVYGGLAVTNYNIAANVLDGCIVAVEGCMDSLAVNYDSKATVNSNTWCVPKIIGCMVPYPEYASASFSTTQVKSNLTFPSMFIDEPTETFSPTTTYHEVTMCGPARYGCNDTDATNYDALATVSPPGSCYYAKAGCLSPAAANFRCDTYDYDTPCTATMTGADAVTIHSTPLCRFSVTESPSPPPPPTPPGGSFSVQGYKVEAAVIVQGSKSEVEPKADQFAAAFSSLSDNIASMVTVLFEDAVRRRLSTERRRLSGAVKVTMSAILPDESSADAAASALSTNLGSTGSSATAALASAGLTGVTVSKVESVGVTAVYVEDADTDESNVGGLIGGIVGGIGGFLMLIGIYCGWKSYKKKNKDVYPA